MAEDSPINVRCVTDPSRLLDFEAAWNELVCQSEYPLLSSTFPSIYAHLLHAPRYRDAQVFLAEADGLLCGAMTILPQATTIAGSLKSRLNVPCDMHTSRGDAVLRRDCAREALTSILTHVAGVHPRRLYRVWRRPTNLSAESGRCLAQPPRSHIPRQR